MQQAAFEGPLAVPPKALPMRLNTYKVSGLGDGPTHRKSAIAKLRRLRLTLPPRLEYLKLRKQGQTRCYAVSAGPTLPDARISSIAAQYSFSAWRPLGVSRYCVCGILPRMLFFT